MATTYDHSPGVRFDLTVPEARKAVRGARNVYAAIIIIEGGCPNYVKISKSAAMAELDGVDDKYVTTFRINAEGDVYIN